MADRKSAPSGASLPSDAPVQIGFSLPIAYRAFFLLIEPLSALVGAYYAYFDQEAYLDLTHAASAPRPIPLGTRIVLSQLANLYLFFAINEALVLRATSDLRVWKRVLFCLLVGDLGHLYTVRQLGLSIYFTVHNWNAIDWGNIGFVYLGALMRLCFLFDMGMPSGPSRGSKLQNKRAE